MRAMRTPAADVDAVLFDAWRGGDARAGEELMRRNYDAVHRFFEVRASFVADDLTQHTFLACIDAANTIREAVSFRSFLFRVARRQYIDHQRRKGRKAAATQRVGFDDGEFKTSMSTLVARQQEQHLLLQGLARLPEDSLCALQLYYWDGMRTGEIGEVLGIPASTVSSRLARARELLRIAVEEISMEPSVRKALLKDLSGWTRSLAGLDMRAPRAER